MALPFGAFWLCILLSQGCVCFQAEQGNNIGHGYPVISDEVRSYGGVLAPDTSDRLYSGASLNMVHDSVHPMDQIQAMRPHSFVSHQREPVSHGHRKGVEGPVTSPTELKLMQNKPASEYDPDRFFVIPYRPVLRKPERANNGYDQHPLGTLLKAHTQNEAVAGVSFPTIRDLKQFIESMKTSSLMPGSDTNIHFQTAWKTMENEMLTNTQSITEEPQSGYRSNSAKSSAQNDPSENEVWNEPMNTEFQQGNNYEMPSESLSVPDPAISSSSPVSTSEYARQDSGPGPVFYPSPDLDELEHISSNFDNLTSNLDEQGKDVQTTSNKQSEQRTLPSSSLSGEDFSSSDHVTAPPTTLLTSPAEGLSHHASKTSNIKFSLSSEQNIQKPTYVSSRISDGNSLGDYRKPSGGFDNPSKQVLQGRKLSKEPQANVFSTEKPFDSSVKSKPSSSVRHLYVSTPRSNLSIPARLPKLEIKPAPSAQTFVSVDKASKDINHPSTVHLLVSSGFHSSLNNRSPQSSVGHGDVQKASPHDPQGELSTTKQPVKSHLGFVFNVKPFISHDGSSGHDDYLSDNRVDVTHPSISNAQAEGQEKSDLSTQNQVPIMQEYKHMRNNKPHTQIPVFNGFDSTQNGSQVSESYVSFNSPPEPAPNSQPKKAFASSAANEESIKQKQNDFAFRTSDSDSSSFHPVSRGNKGMFRNFGTKNIISSRLPVIFNPNTKQKSQVSKQKRKANIKKPRNMTYRFATQLPVSKVFDPTSSRRDLDQRNGGYANSQRLTLPTGSNMPRPHLPSYMVKSRSSYVRGKMYFSQTHYMPSWLSDGKAATDLRKPATSQHEHKNTRSQNIERLEVQ